MKTFKTALIIGVSGQDGAYLSNLLIQKKYVVHGTSRDIRKNTFLSLEYLKIKKKIKVHQMNLLNFQEVKKLIENIIPDEIYNLSGISSVGLSFKYPKETFESITISNLNLLEAIRVSKRSIKLYNACSSECFGEMNENGANEKTPFNPLSPYSMAKASAFWQGCVYRKSYDMFVCSGILFNHESPLRPKEFVTRKIISTALSIANGTEKELFLGNLSVKRDWGWAPEYVEAMWLMLQLKTPSDFVIATGKTNSLQNFAKTVFQQLDLKLEDHIKIDNSLMRPNELKFSKADVSKATNVLGWKAKTFMQDVIKKMIIAEKKIIEMKRSC